MLNSVKRFIAVTTLATVVSTFSVGFVPAVTEAAPPPPRGGVHAVYHRPAPRPAIHQPRPPMHRPPMHRPAPRPHWRPAPPPPRSHYDRHASRDRRIARGVAAVAVIAALFGAR